MDGQTAFEHIAKLCRRRQWDMPSVVFCTGYTPPEALKHIVSTRSSKHGLLIKPVDGATIVDAIRSRLHGHPPPRDRPQPPSATPDRE